MEKLGGRLFPGYHRRSQFTVKETSDTVDFDVRSEDGSADVRFSGRLTGSWSGSRLFKDYTASSEFFRQAPCGFSCGRDGKTLEGLRLETLAWRVEPLEVIAPFAAFYSDEARFPRGSVEFDHALLMRGLPHEWHELNAVPELAGDFHAP